MNHIYHEDEMWFLFFEKTKKASVFHFIEQRV
jgi:hypothetical protein